MSDFCTLFEQIFSECGLSEYIHLAKSFERLGELLKSTNDKYNLTAITDDEGIIRRHFADSLMAAKHIPSGASVIDVGTGGGFPALPLAIARDDIRVTALDSTAKKLDFIKYAAKELSLENRTTLYARAEEAGARGAEHRERYDVAVSRAVARLNILSELCMPLVKVGGLFVALKGADGEAELSEAIGGIARLGGMIEDKESFELPLAGARVIISIRKERATDGAYPRAFAKIKKSPIK